MQVVDPTSELGAGQIYDSNRSTLLAALREQGFQAVDMGIARDRLVICVVVGCCLPSCRVAVNL